MKTNLDKLFKANSHLEKEGVDFSIDETTSFKVRRFSSQNPRMKAAMTAYYKPYARQIEMGTLSPEKNVEVTVKVFIDVCLVSWKGVLDETGKPIEFNKENALKLFKELPDLFDTLWKHSQSFDNYKEDLGNS